MVRRRQILAIARRDDEQGAVIILLALFIVTLLVMVALVIDIGNAGQTRRQAQNAADAAALAAAVVIAKQPDGPDLVQALSDAKRYVVSNYGNVDWSGCTDTGALNYKPEGPTNQCISFNDRSLPDKVRVRIPTRAVETFFGSVAGLRDISVSASATAQIPDPTTAPCGLCVLSLNAPNALDLPSDGGALTVNGNGVVVNSDASPAASTVRGRNYLKADDPPGISVVGRTVGDMRPGPQPLSAAIPDPLSGIPAPSPWIGRADDRVFRDVPDARLSPGNYHDVRLMGDTTLTLDAGIYVITGEVTVESTAALVGNGVTIYFTCGGNGNPVPCDGRDNDPGRFTNVDGTVLLTAPTSGSYKGMALFYDRNNPAGLTVTPTFTVTGTVYLVSGKFTFEGDEPTVMRSMVVADTVVTAGDGELVLNYDPSENAEIRQIPTLFR